MQIGKSKSTTEVEILRFLEDWESKGWRPVKQKNLEELKIRYEVTKPEFMETEVIKVYVKQEVKFNLGSIAIMSFLNVMNTKSGKQLR